MKLIKPYEVGDRVLIDWFGAWVPAVVTGKFRSSDCSYVVRFEKPLLGGTQLSIVSDLNMKPREVH